MTTAAPTHGQTINALQTGKFANLAKLTQGGSLEARKLATGAVMLYWRITLKGKTHREPIGVYDPASPPKKTERTARGYSIAAAMESARAMATTHQANLDMGGFVGKVQADKTAAQAQAAQAAAAQESERIAAELANQYTLAALMAQYANHLQAQGRQAVGDVRSITRIHIDETWPDIAVLPANKVTLEQIADMQRKLIESGKGRTANKLRSYVRAAYQLAKDSRADGKIPLAFKSFQVTHNPAGDTKPDSSANSADKNPLSLESMRAYWQAIKPLPGFVGAVLRLHLLTGGQRIAQLVKLETAQIKGETILLLDAKGKPGRGARPHQVPLIPAASAALAECKPEGLYALSTDGGATHIAPTTLSRWAQDAAAAIPEFQAKQIRSGVETILASEKISSEIRGRLQSHGITGVQARHYDGHDYMEEKRHALETLFTVIDGPDQRNGEPTRKAGSEAAKPAREAKDAHRVWR